MRLRITPIRGQAALVLVDIVRRDPLSGISAPPSSRPSSVGSTLHHILRVEAAHRGCPHWPCWSTTAPRSRSRSSDRARGRRRYPCPQPVVQAATARTDRVPTSKTAKSSTKTNGAARGDRDPAEPPAVTGFGGVDVTDYV